MTTVLLNLHNAGLFELNAMIMGMGIFVGGIAQIFAGLQEWKKGNTFASTAFTAYGSFWLSLVAGGATCLVLAVAIRRWLDVGPSRERSGFTAEPLFEDGRAIRAAQAAATLAAMSPGPRVAGDAGFESGGGRSGGGGAQGDA